MAEVINSEAINDRIKLYQRLSSMTEDERGMFMKTILYDEIMNLMNAMQNMKSTSAATWKKIIKRFKSLSDMGFGFDGFDMGNFCKELLPMIGAAAGLFLAIKEAGEKESESSDSANNVTNGHQDLIKMNDNVGKLMESKSLILKYCKDNEKGFSL